MPILIGWSEWVSLPELGINRIKAKIDTGAQTSALHALSVEIINKKKIRFNTYMKPLKQPEKIVQCMADLIGTSEITDSGGHKEKRYVIQTLIFIDSQYWPIKLTLTCRANMRFRMLLGRSALKQRFLVDPNHSCLLSKKKYP